ncbi:hypothetical protein KSF73_00950 [Burkholderiaceae bacterium DAT-1]|nr:hypothetical protein [Burkholderiaceae bacterium DAT-1]
MVIKSSQFVRLLILMSLALLGWRANATSLTPLSHTQLIRTSDLIADALIINVIGKDSSGTEVHDDALEIGPGISNQIIYQFKLMRILKGSGARAGMQIEVTEAGLRYLNMQYEREYEGASVRVYLRKNREMWHFTHPARPFILRALHNKVKKNGV